MHLFALLIAASFATQFVAPSANAFAVAPTSIWTVRTSIPKLTFTPDTSKPTGTNPLYFKLECDSETVTGTAANKDATTWEATDIDISALGALAVGKDITVTTSATEDVWTTTDTATITVTEPAFTVTKTSYTATEIDSFDAIAVNVPAVSGAAADYTFVVSNTLDITSAQLADEVTKVVNVASGGAGTIDLAAQDLAKLTLTVGSKIYVFAAAGDDAAAAAVALAPAVITVTFNPFTISAVTPAHLTLAHTAIEKLVIQTSANTLWPTAPLFRLTHVGAVNKEVVGELSVEGDAADKKYSASAVDLTEILPLTAANPVALKISFNGGATWEEGSAALSYTVKAPAHTVTTPTLTTAARHAWDGKIALSAVGAMSGPITVVVSTKLDITAAGATEVVLGGTASSEGTTEVTVASGDLSKFPNVVGTKYYVYLAVGAEAGAAALLLAPAVITITETTYTVAVTPTTIDSELAAIPLSVKPTPAYGWETVAFKIAKDGGNTPVTGTLTEFDDTGFWKPATPVAWASLLPITTATDLTVSFSLDNGGTWLPATATIAVTVRAFSVTPPEVLIGDIAEFGEIELTFKDTTINTKIKVVLTKVLGAAGGAAKVEKETQNNAVAGVAKLTFTDTDITALKPFAAGQTLYVHASTVDFATALTLTPATIAITKPPTTFEFTQGPLVWSKTLQIPEIVVTPNPTTAWTTPLSENKLYCRYTVKAADSNEPAQKIDVKMVAGSSGTTFKIPATSLAPFELLNGEHTIVVEISEDGTASYLPGTKEISITEKPLGNALFDVSPATIDPTAETVTFEITKKAGSEGTWTKDVYVFLSLYGFEDEPGSLEEDFKTTEVTAGTKYSIEVTMPSEEPLPKDTKIYVYVIHSVTVAAPTGTWLEVPAVVTVGNADPPKASFTVNPDKIDLKKAGKTVSITVEEKTTPSNAAWAEEVYLYFSKSDKETEKAATAMTVTTKSATGAKYSADLTLSTITPALKKDDKLYVYVRHSVDKKAESNSPTGEWLAVPAAITISAAGRAAPLFSLLAAVLFCLVKLF